MLGTIEILGILRMVGRLGILGIFGFLRAVGRLGIIERLEFRRRMRRNRFSVLYGKDRWVEILNTNEVCKP
jgi:hypothetical protein